MQCILNFFHDLVGLTEYSDSLVNEVSSNISVGPFPRIKISFSACVHDIVYTKFNNTLNEFTIWQLKRIQMHPNASSPMPYQNNNIYLTAQK